MRRRLRSMPAVAAALVAGGVLAACATSTSSPPARHSSTSVSTVPPSSSPGEGSGTAAGGGGGGGGASSPEVVTYDFGNARDGVGPATPSLSHVGTAPAWKTALPGGIYGQPLVIGKLVIVATEDDDVYGLEGATGAVAWHFSLGSPAAEVTVRSTPGLAGCGDIFPLGITGTPVIEVAHKELFVAGEVQRTGTSGWEGIEHVMAAASFSATSVRIRWMREMDPPGAGSTYLIPAEQQRSSLTLTDKSVYAEYGGLTGDCGRYQGYVVSLPTTGSGPLRVFRVPTSREGAIWGTGGASVGPTGELYVATGNSANELPSQPFDYGDAVIGLTSTAGGFKIDGYFAPSNWRAFNTGDRDLGSAGPVVLPGGRLIFEIGKTPPDGVSTGYLLDAASLGGLGRPLYSGQVCPNGGYVFGADASEVLRANGRDVTYIFVPCPTGTLALTLGGTAAAPSFSVAWQAPPSAPGNGPPILAGGLVWSLATGADGGTGGADLYGLDPLTGALVVPRATEPVEHFATPGAGDGRIFVATDDGVEAFAPSK